MVISRAFSQSKSKLQIACVFYCSYCYFVVHCLFREDSALVTSVCEFEVYHIAADVSVPVMVVVVVQSRKSMYNAFELHASQQGY